MDRSSRIRVGPLSLTPFAAIAISVNVALLGFAAGWAWQRLRTRRGPRPDGALEPGGDASGDEEPGSA